MIGTQFVSVVDFGVGSGTQYGAHDIVIPPAPRVGASHFIERRGLFDCRKRNRSQDRPTHLGRFEEQGYRIGRTGEYRRGSRHANFQRCIGRGGSGCIGHVRFPKGSIPESRFLHFEKRTDRPSGTSYKVCP